ncbi:MAG: hypothetical protein HOO19_07245 [Rhodospirillaceae bacterium]|jgi:F0F1-type ATP synthase membrane subunit c/vacuolar-type H+-ATPase subunit K|nr:hypothetical protein [Rhodospirillaceae bacterium]MBT3883136.1 hypothetical protein [Rhodospirillaceae bacterium]MBT4115932.1 hypothetical protein [Rhodospirillaceae bacterium]MBT4674399.1 hypothetical protein [Rhodospirillaceae bacterium]MBT4721573.1 hypothetical protein [Rhodospirillaceae bacterium]
MTGPDISGGNWSLWFKAFGLTFLGCGLLSGVAYSQLVGAALSWGLIAAFTMFSTGIAAKVATRWAATKQRKDPSYQ